MSIVHKIIARCRRRYAEWRAQSLVRHHFSGNDGAAVILNNRKTVATVTRWIEEDRYRNSVFSYGLPETVRHLIDVPLDQAPTYTDLMVSLCSRLRPPLRYLEIGVSVGKNLLQMLVANPGIAAVGLDIEEINPVLVRDFTLEQQISWRSTSTLRPNATCSTYVNPADSTTLLYVCADELDPKSWGPIAGRNFNMVFSDALHEPEALLHEYEMLRRGELLAREQFVMVWDDLHSGLEDTFNAIVDKMKGAYGSEKLISRVLTINGWLGSAEPPHRVGIVTRNVEW